MDGSEKAFDFFFEKAAEVYVDRPKAAVVSARVKAFSNSTKYPVLSGRGNFYIIDLERIGPARFDRVDVMEDSDFDYQVLH